MTQISYCSPYCVFVQSLSKRCQYPRANVVHIFPLQPGVIIIETWRRHLSIVDTGIYEAPFPAGCQPLFVLIGCLLLNYFSLLREGHYPTPALQPFCVLTGCLLLNYFSLLREGHSLTPALQPFLY